MKSPHKISAIRQVIRWFVLLTLLVVTLLYLNSAAYSAWVSGGPPNPYPLGWSRRAIGHLCFAFASLLIGIGLFRGIRLFPILGRGTIAFIIIGILLVASPYVGRYILIDKCLDQGESWSYEGIQCSNE